jgi:hypothetical protein
VATSSISSPSCDPGTDIAVLGGAALALRRQQAARRAAAPISAQTPLSEPVSAAGPSERPFMLAGTGTPRGFVMPEPFVLDSSLEIA